MKRVFIDTSPFIYLVEEHPRYLAYVRWLLQRVTDGEIEAVTSVVTLAEVLVKPLRMGRAELAEQYRLILETSPGLVVQPLSGSAAALAASLRAETNLALPDAFQAAVALQAGVDTFICNDSGFRRVRGLPKVVLLDEAVPS
jgi:predicted nucleic acid-binding protein